MRIKFWLGTLLIVAGAPCTFADEVTCESNGAQRRECEMDTHGEVRMTRQLSRAACVEGETWGVSKHTVWVERGCRATFVSQGRASSSGYVASEEYGSSGQNESGGPTEVTCESNGRRKECEMDTRGEVRLVRKSSHAECREGESWGLSRHSVWVDKGCRATFASGGGHERYASNDGGRAPDSAIRACNAVEDRYGEVVTSNRLKPGWWELILRYDDGQYVCNVSESGKVSEYNKLRR